MMLHWMAYATLAGALLAAAGALLERFSPWLAGHRRMLWLGVIGATLAFAAAAMIPSEPSPSYALSPTGAPARSTSGSVLPSAPATIAAERRAIAPASVPVARQQPSPSLRAQSRTDDLDVLLIVIWLAGTTLCLAVLTMSACRVAFMRRTWRESVLAGVPVFVSHDVGPAVIGLVHHGIVVPAWVETLDVDEQRTVMTHEREHVRAGDPLLLWGATLLVAIAPWNVALWYALRRLRHAIEIDCDTRVLRSRPDARAYCTLLLDVGERTLAGVAPVAALAEPSTLLERRIEAMMAPVRIRRGRIAASAALAAALIAAACFTPRPEVAPAARVSELVAELNSLFARDAVRQSLSPADRVRIARSLATAADSVSSKANRSERDGDSTASKASAANDHSVGFGAQVIKMARDSFPEAFKQRDDAIVVMTVYGADEHVVGNYVQRFKLDEVFDILPGAKDSVVGMRNTPYIVTRVVPGWHPRLAMSGSQMMREAPHAVFVWTVLMDGETLPAPRERQLRRTGFVEQPAGAKEVIGLATADSIARSLYPATYAPHDGIPVVGLIFSEHGQLLSHGIRQASHDEVFVATRDAESPSGEFAQSGSELLSLVFMGMPPNAGRWSTIAHRSYVAPALVWTILPGDGPLPSPREEGPKTVVDQVTSLAHRQAHVTLSRTDALNVWIRVYGAGINGVEAGGISTAVRDTIRIRLPATMTVDLGPGSNVSFVSEDGRWFTVSAVIAGGTTRLSVSGPHILLDGRRGEVISVR